MKAPLFPKTLLAFGLFLSLPWAVAQEAKIQSWGTHTFALGDFTGTKDLNFFAGMTQGTDGTQVNPTSFEARGEEGPISLRYFRDFRPHRLWRIPVESGKMHKVWIGYIPKTNANRILYVRMWAANGNMFNSGRLTVADTSIAAQEKNPQKARLIYGSVSANGDVPIWAAFLGVLFWLTAYGAPVTAILLGHTSGTSQGVFVIPPDAPSLTLYYNMTGCTAFSDYNGSFTVPVSQMQPGVAYVLDMYGWCGGGGVGNWAGVWQRAVLPGDLNLERYNMNVFFRGGGIPGDYYTLAGRVTRTVRGPGSCWNFREAEYNPQEGIQYKISGEGCGDFGSPGASGSVYPSFPSLTLRDIVGKGVRPIFVSYGSSLESAWFEYARYRTYTEYERRYTTFTPRAWVRGRLYSSPSSGTATGGGETVSGTGTAYDFIPEDLPQERAFYDPSWTITSGYSWSLGPYTGTCTVKNRANKSLTIYELTPPMTFTGKPGRTVWVDFPSFTLGPGQSRSFGAPGTYYTPEVNFIGWLGVSGCSLITQIRMKVGSESEDYYFPEGFFMLAYR